MEQIDIIPQFITLEKIPSQNFNIVLEGNNCDITFLCWKGVTYNWLTVNNIIINAGVVCHCNLKFNQYRPNIFKGSLLFLNALQDGTEPYYTNFNEKYKLVFLTSEQSVLLGGSTNNG